ncbi:Nudix hydrolase 16, mitochondrial [Dichanthelium oligosanthes]|uniref:Nudix hydrolase 16, mitochondrial n=1 Tax=Dichanthelium oligosanthes TaxID=888268 RepID=A0A1E5V2N8_9POAL|nr:Nudix hydrolase 16, mitochondrial [Dichanthelium oligosanthes]
MCDLVARTGRHLQRYEDGRRLLAGCIPFRYRDINNETSNYERKKLVEVLMINSQSGPGLLFPKLLFASVHPAAHVTDHATCSVHKKLLGFYDFKSKQPEGMCRAAVFALHVKEELASWPEQSTRQRSWLTVPEAAERSRHPWMQEALVTGFSAWLENWRNGGVAAWMEAKDDDT